eukprot:c23105_g7_i1 orf=139-363(-)
MALDEFSQVIHTSALPSIQKAGKPLCKAGDAHKSDNLSKKKLFYPKASTTTKCTLLITLPCSNWFLSAASDAKP